MYILKLGYNFEKQSGAKAKVLKDIKNRAIKHIRNMVNRGASEKEISKLTKQYLGDRSLKNLLTPHNLMGAGALGIGTGLGGIGIYNMVHRHNLANDNPIVNTINAIKQNPYLAGALGIGALGAGAYGAGMFDSDDNE